MSFWKARLKNMCWLAQPHALARGKNKPDFADLASRTERYTPADIRALVEEASLHTAKRGGKSLSMGDFETALDRVRPSLFRNDLRLYADPKAEKVVSF